MKGPHETCDTCKQAYNYTPKNAVLHLFMEDMRCNHITAKCPAGHEERIYVGTIGFLTVLKECKLRVQFHQTPTPELKARAESTWGDVKTPPRTEGTSLYHDDRSDGLPELPPQLRRELYDWMRDHGRN